MSDSQKTPNALIHEQSPYLLQHAHNPVQWLPWGETAFAKARAEEKPILLSVGYSTCHWCHVMERESFEDEGVAELMNEYFVPVKVDREERPDVDATYMSYLQLRTGQGGWPMNVFLTPDLTPFFAGTYFPPEDRGGRAGFPTVLMQVAKLWKTRRHALQEEGEMVIRAMRDHFDSQRADGGGALPGLAAVVETFYQQATGNFDQEQGGFGGAPKFPRPVVLDLMTRLALLDGRDNPQRAQSFQNMTIGTVLAMSNGGMRDHLGGGFHRYSVDRRWHVPHFEKMLYDQAQIATALLQVWSLTGWEELRDAAIGTLEYVHRDLRHPEGGFYSAEDADSFVDDARTEHAEGAFYVWSREQIRGLLPEEDARIFEEAYGMGGEGNVGSDSDPLEEFVGKNVLFRAKTSLEIVEVLGLEMDEAALAESLASSRAALFEAREKRPRPHLDDKVLTAWNGLMISAFAKASSLLLRPDYAQTAIDATRFIETKLLDAKTGQLRRSYRKSAAEIPGFAADYAFYIQGLLDLYEATFDPHWLALAERLQERMNELYLDCEQGGYYSVAPDAPNSILPLKEDHDGAEPAPNSVAALNLLRLAHLLDHGEWQTEAERIFAMQREALEKHPFSMPALAAAFAFHTAPPKQVVITGTPDDPVMHAMTAALRSRFTTHLVIARLSTEAEIAFFADRSSAFAAMKPLEDRATAYVCREFACERPVHTVDEMMKLL